MSDLFSIHPFSLWNHLVMYLFMYYLSLLILYKHQKKSAFLLLPDVGRYVVSTQQLEEEKINTQQSPPLPISPFPWAGPFIFLPATLLSSDSDSCLHLFSASWPEILTEFSEGLVHLEFKLGSQTEGPRKIIWAKTALMRLRLLSLLKEYIQARCLWALT